MYSVSTSFSLNRGRIARMLHLPTGIVYRNMERRVRRVEQAAIRLAPGSMKQGIRVQIQSGPGGEFRGVVKSTHPASIYVINGTRPHRIFPRRPNGVLKFNVAGRTVFAKYVNHPGTKANNFLVEALQAAR